MADDVLTGNLGTSEADRFTALLARPGPILIDGGLATQCEAMGHNIDGELWSARLLIDDPRAIVAAHRAFLDAGAEIIISASYQASRNGLMAQGLTAVAADELIRSSVELAATARDEYLQAGRARPILVAASAGPYGAVVHDGSEYTGDYAISASELREFHVSRLAVLDAAGADVLACETIPSLTEAEVLAGLLEGVATPAWISFSCHDEAHISDGTRVEDAAGLFREHPRVLAVGLNCTAPQFVVPLIDRFKRAVPDKAVIVYPNSGETYDSTDNSWHGAADPDQCGPAVVEWIAAGARIVGGCCRIGSEHIAAMAKTLE